MLITNKYDTMKMVLYIVRVHTKIDMGLVAVR